MIVLLTIGKVNPVVKLDSEGGYKVLAPSVEAFFLDWARGKTGEWEIDGMPGEDHEGITAAGKKAFKAWLEAEGVTARPGCRRS